MLGLIDDLNSEDLYEEECLACNLLVGLRFHYLKLRALHFFIKFF
jgi:hypothetical protein